MRLASALVVDDIREREDGSVDLIGLREDLFFDALPVILERLSLFLELEIAPDDLGVRHQIELRVIAPDGRLVGGAPVRFALPPDYPRPTAPLDPTIFEITFHAPGPHHVEVLLHGEIVRRLRLNVFLRDPA